MTKIEPILKELHKGLQRIYGVRLKGTFLFGSYARGETDENSDIDVALVLDDFDYAGEEISRSSALVAEICLKYACLISIVPIREKDWQKRRSPLLLNIRKEGVAI